MSIPTWEVDHLLLTPGIKQNGSHIPCLYLDILKVERDNFKLLYSSLDEVWLSSLFSCSGWENLFWMSEAMYCIRNIITLITPPPCPPWMVALGCPSWRLKTPLLYLKLVLVKVWSFARDLSMTFCYWLKNIHLEIDSKHLETLYSNFTELVWCLSNLILKNGGLHFVFFI